MKRLLIVVLMTTLFSCVKQSELKLKEETFVEYSSEMPMEGVVYTQTFETSLTNGMFYEYPSNNYNAMSREIKDGDYAVKVFLRADDQPAQYGGTRVELIHNANNDKTKIDSTHRWWSAKYFFPADYAYDRGTEIIMQWHEKNPNCSTSPPYAISIVKDSIAVSVRYSTADYCQYPSTKKSAYNEYGVAKLPKGRWIKLQSYYDPYVGRIILWLDGQIIFDYTGPCQYIGSWHPYLKFGLYKWLWNGTGTTDVTSRTFWIDDFTVARGTLTEIPVDTIPTEPDPVDTIPVVVNKAPIVSAGNDTTIRSSQVTLDGEARDDIDKLLPNYKWSQISGPSAATISAGWNPIVSNLIAGTKYTLRLTVTDSHGAVGYDDITITTVKTKGRNSR